MMRLINWLLNMHYIEAVLWTLTGMFLVLIITMLIHDCTAETFSLRKDEWVCLQESSYSYPIVVGKVISMATHIECVNWKRK